MFANHNNIVIFAQVWYADLYKNNEEVVVKMAIYGVIFDMDGLLLDTEKLYVRFWCEAANFYGYKMQTHHALQMRSLGKGFAVKKLQSFFGDSIDYDAIRQKRIELMNKFIEENGFEKKKGADTLLSFLKENGYKIAVATATPQERAKRYLQQVNLLEYFDEVISAHMVSNGKPAPDIYKFAAKSLNLLPKNCMALEDSPNGILSAYRAGCVPVMVPDLDLPDEKTKPLLYATAEDLTCVIDILKDINNT